MPERPLVVVGASLAGLRAVEAARKTGYTGPVALIGAEPHLPYDRPPLSKAFLDPEQADPQPPTYRTRAELADLGVTLRLGQAATGLDTDAHELLVGDERLPYRALVIATGSQARTLPGTCLPGVHVLRTLDDARRIRAALAVATRTVVVGGGFIGSEVASAARRRGQHVTIVEQAPMPLAHAVGDELAAACAGLHTRNGTDLRCCEGIAGVEGDRRVERVLLSGGSSLAADLVVVGIGASPATGWLEGSGLAVDDGIVCDPTLAASAPDVWAAGDVARWTNPIFGEQMRLEHWTSAAEQGARAARNALDPAAAVPCSTVPYFWSDWYGARLQMVGVTGADEVHVLGDLEGDRWLALYRRGRRLTGALGLNLPSKIMKYRAMISRNIDWDDALTFASAQ